MLISLVTQQRVYSLRLPEQVNGRYGICADDEKDGADNPFLIVEASRSSWYLRPTSRAKLVAVRGVTLDDRGGIQLQASLSCPVELTGTADQAVVVVEPLTEDRQVFHKYVVRDGVTMRVGRGKQCDISYANPMASEHHATFRYKDGAWSIQDESSTNGTFVNRGRLGEGSCSLKSGDSVWIAGMTIVVGSNFVACNNPDGLVTCNQMMLRPFVPDPASASSALPEQTEEKRDFFYRSPRFCRSVDEYELKVDAPPAKQKQNDLPLAYTIGPPLTMGMAMVFSAGIMAYNTLVNGTSMLSSLPMIVMAVTMLIGMVLWPILSRRYQNKKADKEEAKRQIRYREYLDNTRARIAGEIKEQTEIIEENTPSVISCMSRAIDRKRSLWERSSNHDDFMCVRIGKGDKELDANIDFPAQHFSIDDDELTDALRALEREPHGLSNVPISLDLKAESMTGVIGPRHLTLPFARGLIAQLVTLHSYDELKICFIVDQSEAAEWECVRWLPHCWDNDMSRRYYASTVEEMRELALFLEPLISDRNQQAAGSSKDVAYEEHYLIIAADKDLVDKSEILDLLASCEQDVGVNAVLLFDELHNLHKECDTVIDVSEDKLDVCRQHDTSGKALTVKGDIDVTVSQLESVSVALANTKLNLTSQRFTFPNVVPFLEMYGAGKVEHLNAATRWKENNPAVSLAVPVGVSSIGDPFILDLHEKIHGPHGLVAGMTGSGKSEFVLTYVLSLAINFHPDEVAFVLIDYKGGGLAGAFDNEHVHLPHLAGTITNLDGAAIDRSLVSIQSELRRRQAVFNRVCEENNEGTIDIYKYQQMYRRGIVEEPIPHLFIISDEFAELKQQQPDFMEQLISTARIGRSLGVHLILATQKPSGVVNDQIRSNSKFKVCFKVQDKADSMDMLNRPEAASLVETGRFYLQVGFNEYFAQGQSAWAGAAYNPADELVRSKNDAVVVVNNLGRPVMQGKPAAAVRSSQKKQIVAIVDYIARTAQEQGARTRDLWLPPIPEDIYADDLMRKYAWKAKLDLLEACVGELDDPSSQSQRMLTVPFGKKGNAVVCGASGSGKIIFLNAVLYSLLSTYDASRLNVYILDYGSGVLNAYRGAPQVGDVIMADDAERTVNLIKQLLGELESRKKLFAKCGSGLRFGTGEIPNILLVLENVAVFYELYEALEDRLNKIAREGAKYGIYCLMTELNPSDMRFRLAQNFGQTFVMRLNDETDYASLLGGGVHNKRFASCPGRGLVKLDDVFEFQSAHPFSRMMGVGEITIDNESDHIEAFCKQLADANHAPLAKPVRVLPDAVTAEFLLQRGSRLSGLGVGVSRSTLDVVGIGWEKQGTFVASSNDWDALLGFELGLLDMLSVLAKDRTIVLDPMGQLSSAAIPNGVEVRSDADGCRQLLDQDPPVVEDSRKGLCLLVNSFPEFIDAMEYNEQMKMKNALEQLAKDREVRLALIETASGLQMMRFDTWFQACAAGPCGVWIGDGVAEQQVVKVDRITNDMYSSIPAGFGYFVKKGKPCLAKMLNRAVESEGEGDE